MPDQPNLPMSWQPDAIPWQETYPDGTKYALLEGRRDVPGQPFTYAFFIPAGFWDAPHSHTTDARIVVVAGAMLLGYGDVLDKAQAQHYGVGAYLLAPANMNHFDGADEDTVIIGTALGPWTTTYLES